jgi:hypothetical protein
MSDEEDIREAGDDLREIGRCDLGEREWVLLRLRGRIGFSRSRFRGRL